MEIVANKNNFPDITKQEMLIICHLFCEISLPTFLYLQMALRQATCLLRIPFSVKSVPPNTVYRGVKSKSHLGVRNFSAASICF